MVRHWIIQLHFLVVISCLVSCNYLNYGVIEKVNASCSPKDTCSVPRDLDNLEIHNCDCSSLCGLYGTCCIDFPLLNLTNNLQRRLSCRSLVNESDSVFMVDSCSSIYQGPSAIRRRCEHNSTDHSDPFANAPVTNSKSQITYKSLFCAICNHEKWQDLAMWQVMLDCSPLNEFNHVCIQNPQFVLKNIMYIRDKGSWGLWSWDKISDWKFRYLPITFKIPNDINHAVKKCIPDLISNCSADWTDIEVQRLCKVYMGAIYFPQKAYRNVHCAICNHVSNFTEMSCHSLSLPYRGPTTLSFGLLLDIDLKDGDTVGTVNRCSTGQVYDPFSKTCRSIECPLPGYKLEDGQCVEV